MKARSALFTLFGDVVRPAGGNAWLTTLTACMQALGFTAEATRTALHRMAAEGWVAPTKVGRYAAYRLTEPGVERLDAAAQRIYRLRAADWDGTWHLLVCRDADRDAAVAKELRWLGHGRLSDDVWVSPHRQGAQLDRLLDDHGLTGSAVRLSSAAAHDPAESARIVTSAWDLTELRDAHSEFIARWADTAPPTEPRAAFVARIRVVHHWRSFLFLDPGLPAELLPPDWLGDRAAAAFRRLYDAVDEPAWAYYDALVAGAPPLAADPAPGRGRARRAARSDLTSDLHVLQTSR